ncbi:LexA/Signal peptidase [Anaeromyces robustus]|uniref:LexA/Signal peptidase n=1 Tax=Anaeromyces robustus TaxID=1754192 RepID=A0A1Y1X9E8_9FUNG|nr:LexA/Signal peptidase [Anaeromyces robustus]|eukprot:ORX82367.1 LexA/Signal peptidase [Anaeromyces robustus]
MLPTLSQSGDYIFIDKLASKKKYRKGKIVIAKPQKLFFPNYESKNNYKVCKRIVGEPGDIIIVPFIMDDFLNGNLVPEGHVWLQGDNIYDSVDSRDYGPVPIKDIDGIVRFKVVQY